MKTKGRNGAQRDAILRLMDGTRTPAQIAAQTGALRTYVYRVAQQFGRGGDLMRARCAPPMPADIVLRDLGLPPEIAAWLLVQTEKGAALQDVLRGIVTDAYQEETGL